MGYYDKNKNYTDEINRAVQNGQYVLAGELERQRNAKIDGEGLSYGKTNNYGSYLTRDYGEEILAGIRSGNTAAVKEAQKYRDEKTKLSGYAQYAGDDISRKAQGFTELSEILNQPFSYDNGKEQLEARKKELDALTKELRNYGKFEYNPESDPLYAALLAQYQKNGQRAMQDTLAQIAARTGGLASSYAATAGNQAYANHMSELGGRIPELAQLAYEMHSDEYNRKLQQAQMAQSLYESDLARYQNDRNFAYGQFADNRNMAYNRLGDIISGERYEDEREYNRDWAQKEWDYNTAMDERQWDYGVKQDEYAKALDKAQTLASAGDFSGFRALGYTDAEINTMKYAYAEEKRNSSKKSNSSGVKKTEKPVLTLAQVNEAIEDGKLTPNVLSAYEYYYGEAYEDNEDPSDEPEDKEGGMNYIAEDGKAVKGKRTTNMSDGSSAYLSANSSSGRNALGTVRANAGAMAKSGASAAEINSYIESVADKLTDADLNIIRKYLDEAFPDWDK
ncbi:MAG: hypothetical protein IJN09_06605 [Oscillospiraceae bacterium]|nr:hypothetical protein [Oscillospiraceae bacterium]